MSPGETNTRSGHAARRLAKATDGSTRPREGARTAPQSSTSPARGRRRLWCLARLGCSSPWNAAEMVDWILWFSFAQGRR
eukprot:CAMPEP_0175924980 /NCGR_PEP_ID=MMETSP0108-20121206/15403_1 /TAXON_ID=195067 ORGANISM="Goniomonas pacifica, Strain CCMP1869" /NCGR_SAMPLE_ID=MMETSP0108 /ASSEMBLY_ACC=CAM_ASM_000204 /LENGTH=79 /DNA_ID=CAMNT_0017248103 /DNA_START=282 /DNA_END=521 /DNA_ORIENTATION=-